jgi:hypothetical protein
MGVDPVVATENAAACPAVTVWLTGCAAIEGATIEAFTVNVAALLVKLPAVLRTSTVN